MQHQAQQSSAAPSVGTSMYVGILHIEIFCPASYTDDARLNSGILFARL